MVGLAAAGPAPGTDCLPPSMAGSELMMPYRLAFNVLVACRMFVPMLYSVPKPPKRPNADDDVP